MTIYRNFKRAREETFMWEKAIRVTQRLCLVDRTIKETSECRHRAFFPPIDSLPSPSASLVDDFSVTEGNDSDDHDEVVSVQGHGLSSSCSFSSTASRAESINAAACYTTSGTGDFEVDTQNTVARECQMRWCAPPVSACVTASRLTAAHAEALRVFETVLDRVSVAHEIHCPLCSPSRPPRWGRCAQPALPNRPALAHGPDAGAGNTTPIYPEKAHVVDGDVGTLTALEAHRQHLLRRACSLLKHHDNRLRYLRETKPTLFKETVEFHPLAVACAQLGGLPLLRALSATL